MAWRLSLQTVQLILSCRSLNAAPVSLFASWCFFQVVMSLNANVMFLTKGQEDREAPRCGGMVNVTSPWDAPKWARFYGAPLAYKLHVSTSFTPISASTSMQRGLHDCILWSQTPTVKQCLLRPRTEQNTKNGEDLISWQQSSWCDMVCSWIEPFLSSSLEELTLVLNDAAARRVMRGSKWLSVFAVSIQHSQCWIETYYAFGGQICTSSWVERWKNHSFESGALVSPS